MKWVEYIMFIGTVIGAVVFLLKGDVAVAAIIAAPGLGLLAAKAGDY